MTASRQDSRTAATSAVLPESVLAALSLQNVLVATWVITLCIVAYAVAAAL